MCNTTNRFPLVEVGYFIGIVIDVYGHLSWTGSRDTARNAGRQRGGTVCCQNYTIVNADRYCDAHSLFLPFPRCSRLRLTQPPLRLILASEFIKSYTLTNDTRNRQTKPFTIGQLPI